MQAEETGRPGCILMQDTRYGEPADVTAIVNILVEASRAAPTRQGREDAVESEGEDVGERGKEDERESGEWGRERKKVMGMVELVHVTRMINR